MKERYSRTLEELKGHAARISGLSRIRPNILAEPLYKLVLPSQRRGIVFVEGVGRLYIDPSSHLGSTILADGVYEADTVAIFREHVKAGDTVLDIGANEGVMSACAANLVGATGCVVAVEPQARLLDILEINLSLNATGTHHVIHGAVSDADGEVEISLHAEGNTGASSIVRKYRWSSKTEIVRTCTVQRIASDRGINRFDFVKIDVEGYEPEVVRSLHAMMEAGQIGKILVDYHAAILAARSITPQSVHEGIVSRGFKVIHGSPIGGYALYG